MPIDREQTRSSLAIKWLLCELMGSVMSLMDAIGGSSPMTLNNNKQRAQLVNRPLKNEKRAKKEEEKVEHVFLTSRQVYSGHQMELIGVDGAKRRRAGNSSAGATSGDGAVLLGPVTGRRSSSGGGLSDSCTARAGYAAAAAAAGRRESHECDALANAVAAAVAVVAVHASRADDDAADESARQQAAVRQSLLQQSRPKVAQQPRHSSKPSAQLEEHEQKNKEEGEPSAAATSAAAAATTTTTITTPATMKTKTIPSAQTRKKPLLQKQLAITQTNCLKQTTTKTTTTSSTTTTTTSSSQSSRTQHNRPHGQHAVNQIKLNNGHLIKPVPKNICKQQQQQQRLDQQVINQGEIDLQLSLKSGGNKLNTMRCPQQLDRKKDAGRLQQCDEPILQATKKTNKLDQKHRPNPPLTTNPNKQRIAHSISVAPNINPSFTNLQISSKPTEDVASNRRNSSGNLLVPARNNLKPKNNSNNNNLQQHRNNQQRTRNQRSLSTSSSLASSASSSPSSSMIQIYSQKEVKIHNRNNNSHRINDNGHRKRQTNRSNGLRMLQTTLSSSSSSSASSTISTCSSNDSTPLRLTDTDDVMVSLLHSTTNLSIQSSSPLNQTPNYLVNNHYNQHQPSNLLQTSHPCWHIYSNQQQDIHLDNHCRQPDYPSLVGLYPAPPPRPWLRIQQQVPIERLELSTEQHQKLAHDKQEAPEFSVISYNVLCDRMVSNEMFPSSPDIALDWFYRRELILRELLDYNADIIALQELEMEQYETYFKPQLEQFGHYDSIFEPKSRARTMDCHKRRRVDGCAIFFKYDRFKLIQRHLLEFSQIAMANAQGSAAMLNRVMTKDNIGIAAILQFIEPQQTDETINLFVDGLSKQQQQPINPMMNNQERSSDVGMQQQFYKRHILVCNTHIHWDPEHCDVKLVQTIMLMNELKCITKQFALQERVMAGDCLDNHKELNGHRSSISTNEILSNKNKDSNSFKNGLKEIDHIDDDDVDDYGNDDLLPLVLLGDFNSLPNSGVTNYLTGGRINSLHKDFKNFKYTSCSNALSITGTKSTTFVNDLTSKDISISSLEGNISNNNNNNNCNNQINRNLRRQSSPAWYFYSPSSSPNLSASFPKTTSSSATLALSNSSTSTNQSIDEISCDDQILNYKHPFELTSAYGKDTMPYTNYTIKFKAVIDYIFYSRKSFNLLGLLGPIDKNWLKGNRIKGFPQPHLPSDHLPLLVRLKLNRRPNRQQATLNQAARRTTSSVTDTIPIVRWPNATEWDELDPSEGLILDTRAANPTKIIKHGQIRH